MGMKRGSKLFALMIFGLLVGSLLVGVIAGAENEWANLDNPFKKVSGSFAQWWNNIDTFDIAGVSITGFIGIFILGAFLFVIFSYIPKINDNKILVWILSFGTAAAFVLLIRPEELYGITISYKSLALSFLTLLPLAAIFMFSVIIEREKKVGILIFTKILWVVYLIYTIATGSVAWYQGKLVAMSITIFFVQIGVIVLVLVLDITGKIANKVNEMERGVAEDAAGEAGANVAGAGRAGKKFIEGVQE